MQVSVLIRLEALSMHKSFLKIILHCQFAFNQLYKQHSSLKKHMFSKYSV